MNEFSGATPADASRSVLIVIDVQEKLFPLMQEKELLGDRISLLLRGAESLGVPVIITEQYVQGLGRTIGQLPRQERDEVVEKTTFSCHGEPSFREALRALDRPVAVICGIEAHICVMQTALDLLSDGYDVLVVEDAVSSRLPHARDLGIARMRQAGAGTASAEGILFEWLGRCDRPEFKALLPLFKESH